MCVTKFCCHFICYFIPIQMFVIYVRARVWVCMCSSQSSSYRIRYQRQHQLLFYIWTPSKHIFVYFCTTFDFACSPGVFDCSRIAKESEMSNRNCSNDEANGPSERRHVGRRAEGREEIQFWFYQRIDMEVFHVVSIVVSRLLHAKWYFSRGAKQFSFGCMFAVCECILYNMWTSCDAPKCENCGSTAALSSPHRSQYVRFSASSVS